MKKLISLIVLTILFNKTIAVFADSPLTSTNFSSVYMDIEEVKYASEHGLDNTLLEFLISEKVNSVSKIAVINALSWGNTKNVILFENYLLKKRKGLKKDVFKFLRTESDKAPEENEQTLLLSADDLICWTYLQTMGDYNRPNIGMRAAFFSYGRDLESMAHVVVFTLIAAQKAFDNDWCKVYTIPKKMLVDEQYTKNILKPEALKIILDYTGLYAECCTNNCK